METTVNDTHELFWKAFTPDVSNKKRLQLLTTAARQWRRAGQHCYAGYAMSRAVDAALFVQKQPQPYLRKAWLDFAKCIECEPPGSLESLAALIKWDADAKRQKWIAGLVVGDLLHLRRVLW